MEDGFSGVNSGVEFSFGGAQCCNSLSLGAIHDSTTIKHDSVSSSGTTFPQIINICGINKAGQLGIINLWKVFKASQERRRNIREIAGGKIVAEGR